MSDKRFWIRLSDDALDSIIMAALESYCIGDGRESKANSRIASSVETGGLMWGTISSSRDDRLLIKVERIAQSLSAGRTSGSFDIHYQAPYLLDSLMIRRCPELTLLGEFHTHPYERLQVVNEVRGHEFSDGDISCFTKGKKDEYYWKRSKFPLMMAMTICRIQRVRRRIEGEQIDWNCYMFEVGEFRFWLRAMVGYVSSSGSAKLHTPNVCTINDDDPVVFLDLNTKFYNTADERILHR